MNLEKSKLESILKGMGFTATSENTYVMMFNERRYLVDFKHDQVCRTDGQYYDKRVESDKDDEFLTSLHGIVAKAMCNGDEKEVESPSNENEKFADYSDEEDSNCTIDSDNNKVIDIPEQNMPVPVQNHMKAMQTPVLDLIEKYVGNDVLEVFGDTGTGKSKLALHVAQEAIADGRRVNYLDTERNLTDDDLKSINGATYKYTPDLDEIKKIVQKLPAGDVVIIDSIGFPILTEFSMMSLKERGDALLSMIAIFGTLKKWCYHNNGFALVTNQPESEFNKKPDHILRPFGDKSQFAAKEIWKTEYTKRTSNETKSKIIAFRSRSAGYQTKVADMSITDNGVEVKA